MTHEIIEIAYTTDSNDGLQIDADDSAYEQVKDHLVAIEHNMNNGITSTLYRVEHDADDDALQTLVDSERATRHGIEDGVKRGMEIQPGTPTDAEVDTLKQEMNNVMGVDPTTDVPSYNPADHIYNDLPNDALVSAPSWEGGSDDEPGAGGLGDTADVNGPPDKTYEEVMKQDMPSIGEGKWLCTHPDHTSVEKHEQGTTCSLGHSDDVTENEYACPHRQPFDPTTFL